MRDQYSLGFNSLVYLAFSFCLVGNALDAYSIVGIPIPWIVDVVIVGTVVFIVSLKSVYVIPGNNILLLMLVWIFIVSLFNLNSELQDFFPHDATTSYPVYLMLRYFALISFVATLAMTYWLLKQGYSRAISKIIVNAGFFFLCLPSMSISHICTIYRKFRGPVPAPAAAYNGQSSCFMSSIVR